MRAKVLRSGDLTVDDPGMGSPVGNRLFGPLVAGDHHFNGPIPDGVYSHLQSGLGR
jgi:hypothetical protein